MYGSVRRLTDAEATSVKPRRLSVVTVKPGDTIQTLSNRMAYADAKLERFLVLNGLSATSRLTTGQRVKIVIY